MAKKRTGYDGESELVGAVTYTTPLALKPEEPTDELPEELTETPTTPPQLYITLEGKEGQLLHGGVNGVPFSLPCGVEIPVTEPIYHAVKAHITNERQE